MNKYQLSPLQRHIWSLENSALFYLQAELSIQGELDIDRLKESLFDLVGKYDILRTTYLLNTELYYPFQVVQPDIHLNFMYHGHIGENFNQEIFDAYNCQMDSPLFVAVTKIGERAYRIHTRLYALAGDAVSLKLIISELFQYLKGDSNSEFEAPLSYLQYSAWSNDLVENPDEDAVVFWNTVRKDLNNAAPLYLEFRKRKQEPCTPSIYPLTISNRAEQLIRQMTKEGSRSTEGLVMMFWRAFLFKHNSTSNFTIGVISNNRQYEELNTCLGAICKALPLTIPIGGNEKLTELFDQTNRLFKDTLNNEEYYTGNDKTTPFSVGYEYIQLSKAHPFGDVQISLVKFESNTEQFKIKLFVQEYPDLLDLSIYYDSALFDKNDIEIMATQFLELMENWLQGPEYMLRDISVLNKEQASFLYSINKPIKELPDTTFLNLFEKCATANPYKIALEYDGHIISYEELNRKADQLSNYLIDTKSIKKGDVIGIMMDHSDKMVITILAIMKAGAVFLPLDQNYPVERLKYIYEEASVHAIIYQNENLVRKYEVVSSSFLILDDVWKELDTYDPVKREIKILPADSVYIIYTSGSTGVPKGIPINSKNILNYLLWAKSYYFNREEHCFAFFTPLTFDLTYTSLFTTLLRGDKLKIYSNNLDVSDVLTKVFQDKDVNVLKITPSHVLLLDSLEIETTPPKTIILGGESLTSEHVKILKKINDNNKIFNEYGPTEATVGCSIKELHNEHEVLSIGKPIDNVHIYVMNENQMLQPIGIPGEICLSGLSVADGYLKEEQEKFIIHPFEKETLLYRTGDVGYWLPNGELMYLGRNDEQVKYNGYRVELKEIEKLMLAYGEIQATVVLLRREKSNSLLTAYFTSRKKEDTSALLEFLKGYLPEYMIPSYAIQMNDFHLTSNGKIDRQALPHPLDFSSNKTYEAPITDHEKRLVALWEEIFLVSPIGISDGFIALGGNSIKAIKLLSSIRKEFKVKIDLKLLLDKACIKDLAIAINSLEQETQEIELVPSQPVYDVPHGIKGLFLKYKYRKEMVAFNMSTQIFMQDLDKRALDKAVMFLLNRHESLRCNFLLIGGEVKQKINAMETLDFKIDYFDCHPAGYNHSLEDAHASIGKRIETCFDVQFGPLLNVSVYKLDHNNHLVSLVIDHIISDAWSIQIIQKEIAYLYDVFKNGGVNTMAPLNVQLKEYASWQNDIINGAAGKKYQLFWKEKLSDQFPILNLPVDHNTSACHSSYREELSKEFDEHFLEMNQEEAAYIHGHIFSAKPLKGASFKAFVGNQLYMELTSLAKKNNTSLFAVLTTGLHILMYKWTSQNDFIIGTPVSLREHEKFNRLIGWFLDTLVIRNKIQDTDRVIDFMNAVSSNIIEALDNRYYPFEKILDDLNIPFPSIGKVFIHLVNFGTVHNKIVDFDFSHSDKGTPTFDVNFTFHEYTNGMQLVCDYRSELFSPVTIEKMVLDYINILEELIRCEKMKINDIKSLALNLN